MTAGLVDFHCHLDLYPDFPATLAAAEKAGVYTLAVTTTPKAWPRNRELAKGTRHIRAALGFHPQLAAERINELPLWEKFLPEARYVGEVGLDAGPRFYRSLDVQRRAFEHILSACAEAGGKILTVHSVRAIAKVLDMIEARLPADRGRVVLHWFTGTVSEARRAASMGCYFSVNADMLRNDRGRKLVSSLPIDRILTETDGPFTSIDGRPCIPQDVVSALQVMAASRSEPVKETAAKVRQNLKRLLEQVQHSDLK